MKTTRLTSVTLSAAIALAAGAIGPAARAAQEVRQTVPPQQQTRDTSGGPTTGTAAVLGLVVHDDETNRPVRRATVTLTGGNARLPRTTMTDDAGRFVFPDLPSGSFNLMASKPAYVNANYRPPGALPNVGMLTLAAGQRETVTIRMMRGAVITGIVRDAQGQPVPGVRVQAFGFRMQAGQRMQSGSRQANTPTDDQGRYRIFGLTPGNYLVGFTSAPSSAVPVITDAELRWARQQAAARGVGMVTPAAAPPPRPGPTMGLAQVFFPGTSDQSRAMPITLTAAEERTGVDIPLMPVALARVTGILLAPGGQPPPPTQITLSMASTFAGGMALPATYQTTARSDREGKFSFTSVPPGQYAILVRVMGPGDVAINISLDSFRAAPMPPVPPVPPIAGDGPQFIRGVEGPGGPATTTLWGLVELPVDGADVLDVGVPLQRPLTLSGRVIFEGSQPVPADLTRVRVSMSSVQSNPLTVSIPPKAVETNGTFVLTGATPGRYRLSGTSPAAGPGLPPWILKSVVLNGRDVLDFPLDLGRDDVSDIVVTFSDKRTEVDGLLMDAAGQPAPGYSVAMFSVDSSFWTPQSRRVRAIRTGADGRFRLIGMPPGEYYMIAIADVSQFDWTDPAMLGELSRASFKFTLAEGEKRTQDIKMAR